MTRRQPSQPADDGVPGRTRLDKWLWAARFYRTRSLAAAAIDAGHVRVDGERVKPSHVVRAGMRVSVRKQELAWHVDVADAGDRRGSASSAAALYRETDDSVVARATAAEQRRAQRQTQASTGRPSKRERRKLADFLNER
jgi:ribosome-associated heat shock protein Hsp15